MTEPKNAARKTIVEHAQIVHSSPGDLHYPDFMFNEDEEKKDVWQVWTTTSTGFMDSGGSIFIFDSEEAAREALEIYPVGSEIKDTYADKGVQNFLKSSKLFLIDLKYEHVSVPEDVEPSLPLQVLEKAGVLVKYDDTLSQEVFDFFDKDVINTLKRRFGEDWEVAAALEYCLQTLPASSPARVAAEARYFYYLTDNDLVAGYKLRDLEFLVAGVEAEAYRSIERGKKAGASGSKASSKGRENRRGALLDAMVDVATNNPDVAKHSESFLVKLGLEKAREENPSLWRQGQGQVMEYAGEIRRGEAGEEAQERYLTLFKGKLPKRSC